MIYEIEWLEESDTEPMGTLLQQALDSEFVLFSVDDALWLRSFDLDAAVGARARATPPSTVVHSVSAVFVTDVVESISSTVWSLTSNIAFTTFRASNREIISLSKPFKANNERPSDLLPLPDRA